MTHDPGAGNGWVAPSGEPAPAPRPPSPPPGTPSAPSPFSPPYAPYAPPPSPPYPPPVYSGYPPPAWAIGPARRRLRGIWFLLPVVIAALSVAAFVAFVSTRGDRLNAADADEQIGERGSVPAFFLAEGHRYFVFHPSDETLVDTPTCSVQTAEAVRPVPLTPPSDVDDWTHDGSREWILVGSFRSPATTDGGVVCRGLTGDMLVRPDDSPFAQLAAVTAGMIIGLLAAVALLAVFLVLRFRSPRQPVVWQPYQQYPPPGWGG